MAENHRVWCRCIVVSPWVDQEVAVGVIIEGQFEIMRIAEILHGLRFRFGEGGRTAIGVTAFKRRRPFIIIRPFMAVVAVEVYPVILGIKLAITVIITHVFAEVVGEDIICFVIAGYIVVEAIGIDDRYEIQFGLVYDLSDHGILLIVFEEIPHVVDV